MKKIIVVLWKTLSASVMYGLAFALQFWWLYLILLVCGAYKTAAKEWGCGAGIVSVFLAFVLPVISFVMWCAAFDRDSREALENGSCSRKTAESKKTRSANEGSFSDRQILYLKLLASMMAKVAKADGHIDVTEIRAAEHTFERLGFTDGQKRICIDAFRAALDESVDAGYSALKMVALNLSYEMRIMAYEILWDIASADGVLYLEEKTILEGMEHWLKLAPGTFERYFRRHFYRGDSSGHKQYQEKSSNHDDLFDAYGELGCNSASSNEELKSAYRNLAKKLHPDVLRAQGMPESLMWRANERMARINAAWDKIKKARRISG